MKANCEKTGSTVPIPGITTYSLSSDALFEDAASLLAQSISHTLQRQGRCVLGIVGGRVMPPLFKALVKHLRGSSGLFLIWLDERLGPEKNAAQAEPFLREMRANGGQLETLPIMGLHPQAALREAASALQSISLGPGPSRLDIAVLSAGEDGHIVSLFPHHKALHSTQYGYVLVEDSPKPPLLRITATPSFICSAAEAFLFFVGDKEQAYENFLDETKTVDDCPAKLVQQIPRVVVFTCLS
jgi:6-phosphogluconolactonase